MITTTTTTTTTIIIILIIIMVMMIIIMIMMMIIRYSSVNTANFSILEFFLFTKGGSKTSVKLTRPDLIQL